MTTFTTPESQIEALYVGYFGRAGDPSGVDYWLSQYNAGMSIAAIAASFSVQTEATNLYPFLKNPLVDDAAHDNAAAFINSVFEDLFNRAENSTVDPTGFAYWLARVVGAASNPQAMGQIIEDIISGATGADATTLQNKVVVADDFTNSLAATTQPFVGNAINIAQSTVTNTTSNPTTVTSQETVISNFINNVAPLPGVYTDLTTGIDHVVITTINTIDHVEGVVDTAVGSTDSTYTIGDQVHGNGLTNLDLAVAGSHSASAALASLVGVADVNILMGQTRDVTFNASLWNNVNNVNVKGLGDDTTVYVDHLNVNNGNGIELSINSTDYGYLKATGHVSGLSYTAEVQSDNGVGTVASFGTAGVNAVVGKSGSADLKLYHYVSKSGANASAGAISIGNVNVSAGVSADATVEIYNYAYVHGTGVHNATAGNITVGAVNYTIGLSGYGEFEVYNEVYAEATGGGNGTVGNITVGNIAGHLAKGADFDAYFYNEVSVEHAGNGSEGNLTVGNVSMTGGYSQYVEVYNYVNDDVKGNATVGNVTFGNVTMVGASGDQEFYIEYNGADAVKGSAIAGNINIGNVTMVGSYYLDFYIEDQGAYAERTGNATSGSVTIGTVAMDAKHDADAYFYVDNYAVAAASASYKGGVATVGSVTIGNVTTTGSNYGEVEVYNYAENRGNVAHNASAGNISIGNITATQIVGTTGHGAAITGAKDYIRIENYASADKGNASVGNVSIGNISVNAVAPSIQAAAVVTVDVTNEARANDGMATAGTLTVGNVTLNVGLAGSAHLYVANYAKGITSADSTGKVTVGNVSMQGGSGAKMGVTVENYAYSTSVAHRFVGSTGGINIGNVTMALTKPLGSAKLFVSETGNQAGQVTVGNVTLTGHTGSKLTAEVYDFGGKGGHTTGITVGNVSLTGAKATAFLQISESGGSTGLLKVGNVSLNAAKVHMSITNLATGGNSGGLQVGNVTLKGNTTSENYISQHASNANGGALTVGNVSMTVGKAQDMKLLVTNTAANHLGTVTIGNVALAIANTKAGAANHVTLDIKSSSTGHVAGGNIQVGNIAISAGGESKSFAAANMAVHVTADSADGTVSVGNISVSGGVQNAGHTVLDNFAHFSNGADALATWFGSTGTSHTTVGSIDYSTYAGAGAYANGTVDGVTANAAGTLIDVDTLKGAPGINTATGGAAIVDNSGQNAINVSFSGTKADIILLQDVQTAVSDSGGVITAAQASVDSITGIHAGDVIGFAAGNFATGFGLTGTTPLTQAGASTYANFLATAEVAIDTNHFAFYSADVGGNTYVAMNNADHVAEVVEVTGIHTFTLDAHGFLAFAS